MTENKEILAKKAYIEYTELQQLRKDLGSLEWEVAAINSGVQRYNEILKISKEVLSHDPDISKSIEGLKPLREYIEHAGESAPEKPKEVIVQSGILLSALESFVRWYLPQEKQRTIGFRSEESS